MKHTAILLALAATASLAAAQAAHKPATAPKAAAHAAAHATATHKTATAAPALPAGVAPVAAPVQTAFALRYQEISIGAGPLAEPNKLYKVAYTGWLASDGRKFDASADHPAQPVLGHDLQPEKNADGSPKTAASQPIVFPQGFGRVIPGWDQGFAGMRIGGKRRLFIPYQLAYGAAGRPTGNPKDPGIPPKADLIFDIELVDVMDIPAMPAGHGAMGAAPSAHPGSLPAGHPPVTTHAPQPAESGTQSAPAAQPAAAAQPQAK